MVLSLDRWVGKVAVVTGTSAGIGAAVAEALVKSGVIVAGLARRRERTEELSKKLSGEKGKLHAVKCDVTKEEDILEAFKWVRENLGPVSILVNNAGLALATTLIDGDSTKWKTLLDTNVLGLCISTRETIKDMKAHNIDGHVIHMNSIGGQRVVFFPVSNVYPASKFAVTALAETLRYEINSQNLKIKITSVSPGLVDTEILQASFGDAFDTGSLDLTCALRSEDIADAVLYALSTPPHVQCRRSRVEVKSRMVLSLDRWVGKVAVVTGTSAGIGAAVAEALVKRGVIVAGLARRKERTEELSKKLTGENGKLHAVKCDLTKEEDILEAFKWVRENLGPVSILVNNAGLGQATTLIDGDLAKWKAIIDTNVLGLCIATREAIKDMKANNIEGHVIHINSVAGHRVVFIPVSNVYPASKFAVTALAETLRHEINNQNLRIKITSVSPGFVETEIIQASFGDALDTSALDLTSALQPEDIADAVLYALSTPPHVQVSEVTVQPVGEKF